MTGPEFCPLADLAREMGLHPETLRLAAQAGEVPGARLYRRRWVVHRPTFAAAWSKAAPGPRGVHGAPKGPGNLPSAPVRCATAPGALDRAAAGV